jgi:MarR family transcriptional regulator, organic hydroperoxide resistance regulator
MMHWYRLATNEATMPSRPTIVNMVSTRYDRCMNDPGEVHALLERIGNLLRQEMRRSGADRGLQPVQLEALNYLAICNRFSNTPQGVAEYLGLTKGTVSQTLKVLEARGLIRKSPDPDDRRVVHLALTGAGARALAESIPPSLLATALAPLAPKQADAIAAALRNLLGELQRANDGRTFGVCRSCRYHAVVSATVSRCQLLGADLSSADAGRICREHLAAA